LAIGRLSLTRPQSSSQERAKITGVSSSTEDAMDNLTKREQPDRSKINMHEAYEVKYWTHALGVSKEELQKVVDKVGNSVATVRKELGLTNERH
jgi:hypothetical protein